jgi:hypothetical protein
MKNIHVLPTAKSSRLYLGNNGNFVFGMSQTAIQSRNDDFTNQNTYITYNEKIKKPCWCIDNRTALNKIINVSINGYVMFENGNSVKNTNCKKVILTTDTTLIADGIQAIDDEFFEWFVKNPSCERVEVEKQYITPLGDIVDFCYDNEKLNYKIIIPQEENIIQV